jgi:hypothetical protein
MISAFHWQESGLTQRAYRREHELPEVELSQWKYRLQKAQRRQASKTQLIPIRVLEASTPRTDRTHWHEPRRGDRGGELALVFDSGLRFEIGNDLNAATLRRVLEVVADVGMRPAPRCIWPSG